MVDLNFHLEIRYGYHAVEAPRDSGVPNQGRVVTIVKGYGRMKTRLLSSKIPVSYEKCNRRLGYSAINPRKLVSDTVMAKVESTCPRRRVSTVPLSRVWVTRSGGSRVGTFLFTAESVLCVTRGSPSNNTESHTPLPRSRTRSRSAGDTCRKEHTGSSKPSEAQGAAISGHRQFSTCLSTNTGQL